MEDKNSLNPLFLIAGIFAFFVFVISFAIFYTTENFSSACGCRLPLWVIIVVISSLGIFVGLITYYIININFIQEKKEIKKNLIKFLDILEENEKEILKIIIENNGEITQSLLSKKTGFNKVKTSRIISKMEKKNMVIKEKTGMSNKLKLNANLRDLL